MSQSVPVFTVPRRFSVQPSAIARLDCGCWPVAKNSASRGSGSPDANTMRLSAPSVCSRRAIGSGADADAVAIETFAQPALEPCAVRADDDVGAPGLQAEREAGDVRAAAERGERPVAPLPAVAVGAMKNRSAVALVEARDRRQVVDDAGRDQQVARVLLAAVAERDAVVIAGQLRAGDAERAELHAVLRELSASELDELRTARCRRG